MKKRLKVRELMQRERLRGEIVGALSFAEHRDDSRRRRIRRGFQPGVPRGGTKLSRTEPRPTGYLRDLSATRAKVPTDINVMPALGQTEKTEDRENVRSARVGEFGAV